jgi:RNA polymerase sigma factor (sigma-70 family)
MTLSTLLLNLPWLTNLAARFTANTAEAEDCAIIAIERIAPRLEEFRTEPQARAFLAKTARNAAIDAQKAGNSHRRTATKWIAMQDYSDEQIEGAIRLRMIIAYGIPTLKPRAQELAALFLEGKSFDEVAVITGLSRKSVANWHGMIIRDLKEWVKRCKLQ